MLTKFDDIIEVVLEHEGGYVNDPDDPGGETNFGIAKRSHPDVDISVEVNEEEFLLQKIERLKKRLDYYDRTLIMQWYKIDEKEKDNFENIILKTLGKK